MRNLNDAVTSLYVLVMAVTAVTVANGKPHQTCVPDSDYAKAILDRYLNGNFQASVPTNLEPETAAVMPFADYQIAPLRPGRSNERDFKPDEIASADMASAPPRLPHRQPDVMPLIGHHIDLAQSTVAKASAPCKGTARGTVNDTLSAATVEKLAAYYEQLKAQQDMIARQQIQQQAYEQQQRRQQEYMAMQQQIQQQYYQQQQHMIHMLEQLRKSPAFASQFAAFIDQKRAEAGNATRDAAASVKSADDDRHNNVRANERDQIIANHGDKDVVVAGADDSCGAAIAEKRLGARQSDKDRDDAKDRDATDDQRPTFEDDQTPPVLEKIYSMVTE